MKGSGGLSQVAQTNHTKHKALGSEKGVRAIKVKSSDGGQGTAPNTGVRIRLAKDDGDIATMIGLGHLLHAESGFRGLPLDDKRMREIGHRGLKDGNPGLFIAERGGEGGDMVGMAIVVLGEYYFSPVRSSTVQLLYVRPDARGGLSAIKLLRAIRRWSEQNQAQDIHVNVTTGIDTARTDRFLRRMGFKQTGGNYVLAGVG